MVRLPFQFPVKENGSFKEPPITHTIIDLPRRAEVTPCSMQKLIQ